MASDAAESCYHKICTDIDISGFGCGGLNPQDLPTSFHSLRGSNRNSNDCLYLSDIDFRVSQPRSNPLPLLATHFVIKPRLIWLRRSDGLTSCSVARARPGPLLANACMLAIKSSPSSVVARRDGAIDGWKNCLITLLAHATPRLI